MCLRTEVVVYFTGRWADSGSVLLVCTTIPAGINESTEVNTEVWCCGGTNARVEKTHEWSDGNWYEDGPECNINGICYYIHDLILLSRQIRDGEITGSLFLFPFRINPSERPSHVLASKIFLELSCEAFSNNSKTYRFSRKRPREQDAMLKL